MLYIYIYMCMLSYLLKTKTLRKMHAPFGLWKEEINEWGEGKWKSYDLKAQHTLKYFCQFMNIIFNIYGRGNEPFYALSLYILYVI